MSTTVQGRVQPIRATAAVWTAENIVLLDAEVGYETDTGKFKIGDGVSTWTALPYFTGEQGPTGNGIASVTLVSTVGLVKTYRITFTDATTFDYTVTDGADGATGNGIASVVLFSTVGLVKTYRITFTDGGTFDYTVTDGAPGDPASVKNSIEVDAGALQFVGDALAPGNSKYYGTSDAGVKGFHDLPSGGGSLADVAVTNSHNLRVYDTFNRSNEMPMVAADSGQNYVHIGNGFSVVDGKAILTNNATWADDSSYIALEVSRFHARVWVTTEEVRFVGIRIIQNVNNWITLYSDNSTERFRIAKRVAGVDTVISAPGSFFPRLSNTAPDFLEVSLGGKVAMMTGFGLSPLRYDLGADAEASLIIDNAVGLGLFSNRNTVKFNSWAVW